jgi:hypothetical protein
LVCSVNTSVGFMSMSSEGRIISFVVFIDKVFWSL